MMKKNIKLIIVFISTICGSLVVNAQKTSTSIDTIFVNLRTLSDNFIYDMKYATADNFLKSNVYGCDSCYVRMATATSLIKANKEFLKLGFRIKIYDCYRPLDIQKKMWKIVPNAKYVANPKHGSVHNRGGAIDITLVDHEGMELDMGTKFDHFGPESAHSFLNLEHHVIENRKFLKSIMEKNGFSGIKSEWWHYDLIGSKSFNIANHRWKCD